MSQTASDLPSIRATVDGRLLRKADRLFTGTTEGRMIELLQNARRAGAKTVQIHVDEAARWITVHDDGRGIEDFQHLLSLGSKGWEDGIEVAEDPAGVGFFSLAPRETIIRSRGKSVHLQAAGWTGASVPITADSDAVGGTVIRFQAEQDECERWASRHHLLPYAAFGGMTVITADGRITPADFLSGQQAYSHPELGLIIEISTHGELPELHSQVHSMLREGYYSHRNVLHGQIVVDSFHGVDLGRAGGLFYLIEMTGAPTELRLMLPARTRIVANGAYEQLKRLLTLDTFRHLQQRGRHTLPFKEWRRARSEFGIQLPEAEPVFRIGLLYDDQSAPRPPEVSEPEAMTVDQGHRTGEHLNDGDPRNAHLLACFADRSKSAKPFIPIEIPGKYAGYSWYESVPTIEEVVLERPERVIHHAWLGCGELLCVERLTVTVRTSDGREFKADLPIACDPQDEQRVYVTPTAVAQLDPDTVWYLLGGLAEEGDTYDTQAEFFHSAWERFWTQVAGPDEAARVAIFAAISKHFGDAWQFVSVTRRGRKVFVQVDENQSRELRPNAVRRR